jgi:hypothetical protein
MLVIFDEFLKLNSNAGNKRFQRELLLGKHGTIIIDVKGDYFDGKSINIILSKLYFITKRYKKGCKRIIFRFINDFRPKDKLTYIIFESIIYMLHKYYDYEVNIIIQKCKTSIHTIGVKGSLLLNFARRNIDKTQFQKKFMWIIDMTHFRRMVNYEDYEEQSKLMYDIKHFVVNLGVNKDDSTKIAEIVAELADNACEHAQSDCLVDIDIAEGEFRKNGDEDGIYYSVNVSVLNFSEKYIWNNLEEKIVNKQYDSNSNRYNELEKAYSFHKQNFNDEYDGDYFFMISTFQNEISGRLNQTQTGGKGLTELLTEIGAKENDGYLLSGNKGISFPKELIQYDDDGWVGFNKKKDFFTSIPDPSILYKSDTYLPGTAYNLTFIYRR